MTPPHRVLYFNSWSTAHGGSATSLLDIVRSLDRRRFDPVVVCPEPGELPNRLAEVGVPVVIHPLSRLNREQVWQFLREVLWYMRFLRQNDVAIVHGNTSSSRRSLLQAAHLAGVPYVQHVRNGMGRPLESVGCRYARRIVVNSNQVGTALRREPTMAHKTVTIYNAVDLAQYDARDNRRIELGSPDGPVVGFVGQIVPRKGVRTLIEAMPAVLRRFPQALLVIVGCAPPDEDEYERSCRERVVELGLESSVRFIGYRRDVAAWMRSFDVFALPTRAEPFGKVVIESMAAGCPVVASRVGGIPEIITSPELGTLIEPDDPDALASAILAYLCDRDRAEATSRIARRHARELFGLQGMIDRLQQLYETVLHERKGGTEPCAASPVA
jgi:glycosyltransferase involved in cell wall biosynthesis